MHLLKSKKRNKKEDNVWSSISDLMSGLMIIFLFISISFMSKVSKENIKIKKEQKAIKQVVDTYKAIRVNIYEDLNEEFKDDLKNWKIVIDPKDLAVRFQEPEVFFDRGQVLVKPQFKNILDDFFPRYIKIIYGKYKNNIEEVRIEGYTSSEWNQDSKQLNSYFNNMSLSQDRTRNVLQYVMNLKDSKQYHKWLIEHLTANGMSYSHRYYDENGNENKKKSRRVEFKIRTNADYIISQIIKEYEDKK
ncbi:OmpA family protein [Clostridium aestuarii]|uniref:OmpA family protein n=1 Tax=Clostridium aestuarii TaxID=338193 RepID=A0ABT4CVJ2_9CLOT|nr:OmpA family protein [Clostridium aestuarii]MCY6482998.1 OmpA family protein [Clostridium aestuarii]